jgi:cellulose synthase/poly-beta-1,6-N-acetylglucosamine synthase-like glycosyltransferase
MNSFSLILSVCFWVSLVAVAYAYVGYPILVWCLARLFGRSGTPAELPDDQLPTVSLLVAAHNEESVIDDRLRNALAMDYPADRLEVVVAADGCIDRTTEIVRRYADRGVRLLEYTRRRGKATALNESLPQLRGEVVMLSDANTFTEPQALRKLVRWFQDPGVGMVCGRLVLIDPEGGSNADGLYWKYETFLKKCEGRLGALLGANGGIYALRRSVYTPIPPETIVDDFVIPLEARLRTGCALVFEADAVAREETPPHLGAEFHRRARIGAGGFQSLGLLWRLLNPALGGVAFTFVSHKLLRWLGPFFLLTLLVTSFVLREQPLYLALFASQLAFYLLSALVSVLPPLRAFRPLRLTSMFTGMNAALLVGFWRWLWGTQKGAWKRTARIGPAGVGTA